ncbi:aminomethyl transferase family protein [Bradyrhizobium commune]|uniref:Aminomethyl transferase family protein n=1 Tax=Bradyrhizobium commune TaxID=83627 RepID=A0A7S9D3W7_9BRAD|nr:aminomethyl transferase family protein [Bradyrhizobium commune]QPF90687.1 aminomethyl transferase family protein [Bradyrhizobium commune]
MSVTVEQLRIGIPSIAGWGNLEYTDWIDESESWKKGCYLDEWSFLDELRVSGPDALTLFSSFAVNSFAKFEIGQAKRIICCNRDGKIIGEGILTRFGLDEFEFQALGPVTTWLEYQLRKGGYNAQWQYRVSKFKFQVQGVSSLEVLEKLVGPRVRDVRFMHQHSFPVAGHATLFLRQGTAAEIGFELQGPLVHADDVREAILSAGRASGIRRRGSRTAMINHLETCFPIVTHDYLPAVCQPSESEFYEDLSKRERLGTLKFRRWTLDSCLKVNGSFHADHVSAWYRSPVDLGWAKNVKFDHDFYGREALEREIANPRRKIVTLIWSAEDCQDVQNSLFRADAEPYEFMDMPRQQQFCMDAHSVLAKDREVGVATSRSFSFTFRQMMSHCVIDLDKSEVGTEVEVIWGNPGKRQKRIRATVAPSPYKWDHRRTNLKTARAEAHPL